MNPKLTIALAAAALLSLPATVYSQEKLTAQQQRMKDCNVEAKDQKLKGEERQHFMSSCLKGEGEQKLSSQQEKMKTCNKRAGDKELKGDKRQEFMSECLRADKGSPRTSAAGGR